jgi:integrase/recombinase XerD
MNDLIQVVNKDLTNQLWAKDYKGMIIIKKYMDSLKTDSTRKSYFKSIMEFFTWVYGGEELTFAMMIINPSVAMDYKNFWFKSYENGKMKASTFNAKIKGIKQFYEWLIFQTTSNTHGIKIFQINPFAKVAMIAENDTEGSEPLSPEEIQLMLDNPYGNTPHIQERNSLIFELAITTGIRNDALLSITKDSISKLGNDWILTAIDKEDKKAEMPINNYYDRLMKWYEKDLRIRTDDNNTIFNLHPHSANRIIREWANNLGIDKRITFHSLRTTTAVQVYHTTENKAIAQEILHHSHMDTTDKYLLKEHRIRHEAEGIIVNIKALSTFDSIIESMSKEELVALIKGFEPSVKSQIVRMLSK